MTEEIGTGKNIWDVIFSLEKHHFPIQRNYLREPRGSLNPINSQVTTEVCQKTLDDLRESAIDPYDMYALDFELNYLVRKLVDFTLFADLQDARTYADTELLIQEDYVQPIKMLSDKYGLEMETASQYLDGVFIGDFGALPRHRDEIRQGLYANFYNRDYGLIDYAKNLKALEHIIETSTWDWKTKAVGFLRASSIIDYSPADDETIIYLMHQKLNDPEIEKEARYRWKRYQKEWKELFFTDKNPFDDTFCIDRLRFIHWDALNKLRLFEGQLPDEKRYTYEYNIECQHLLSPPFLSDFTKAFSLFRTDLNVDPVRSQLDNIVKRFYGFISGKHLFEYNYTVTDIYYLTDLLFSFVFNRFRQDVHSDNEKSWFCQSARNDLDFKMINCTSGYIQQIPMITLIALEVHAVYFSHPKGNYKFLQKAKKWLLEQQTAYGYWYDGVNSPEYTTVLVLDALNLIDENDGLTFPYQSKIVLPQQDAVQSNNDDAPIVPILIINFTSQNLVLGRNVISPKRRGLHSKTWDFLKALVDFKNSKMALPIKSDDYNWKNQYDVLARLLGGREIIKQFITSNGKFYQLNDNVHYNRDYSVWAESGSDDELETPFETRKKMNAVKRPHRNSGNESDDN